MKGPLLVGVPEGSPRMGIEFLGNRGAEPLASLKRRCATRGENPSGLPPRDQRVKGQSIKG